MLAGDPGRVLLCCGVLLLCWPWSARGEDPPLAPSAAAGSPAPFVARVIGVADGDTLRVLQGNKPLKIRLAEIDCPEKSQGFGQRARQFTASLAAGQQVRIVVQTHDRYGRAVAEVFLPDGRSLNRELVRAGLAWQYLQYSFSRDLEELEEQARQARRGLWAEAEPQPPWEYRRQARHRPARIARNTAPQRQLQPEVPALRPSPVQGPVLGNRRSKVYHLPGCPSFGDVSLNNQVFFTRVEDAERAGYRRARNCPPGQGPSLP